MSTSPWIVTYYQIFFDPGSTKQYYLLLNRSFIFKKFSKTYICNDPFCLIIIYVL